jgi:hypothetical protein
MFADDTSIPLPALYVDTVDPAVTYTDGRVKAGRLWLDTSTGVTGTLKKRNAANDGWDTLINFDVVVPAAHAPAHEDEGSDEIDVSGLSGVLADPQVADKVKESSGPTTLTVGAVADGEFLKRDGVDLVGAAPSGGITELTGDVIAGPGSGSQGAAIANDAVTYAKMQDVSAASRILGRGSSGGAGNVQELQVGTGFSISGTTISVDGSGGGGITIVGAALGLVLMVQTTNYSI